MTTLFINLLAFGTLLSSVFTITSKNPVISVIFLITTFVQAAGYLILMGIQFVGISYIVIYVGAIAVLFLFVIMMINIKLTDILDTGTQYTKNLPLAISIGSLYLFIIFTLTPLNLNLNNVHNILNVSKYNYFNNNLIFKSSNKLISASGTDNNLISNNLTFDNYDLLNKFNLNDTFILSFQQIEVLGHSLYTHGAILLLLLSFILLLAMFATIIISTKK